MNIYIYRNINSKEHHHTTLKKVAFKISFVFISSCHIKGRRSLFFNHFMLFFSKHKVNDSINFRNQKP